MKKVILTVLFGLMIAAAAFADTYIVYDGKTGSEKTIELRKSVAEDMAKQMKNATGEEIDALKKMSKESDIVFIVKEGDGTMFFDLGKGKEQFIEWAEAFGADKDAARFIKVF